MGDGEGESPVGKGGDSFMWRCYGLEIKEENGVKIFF